VSLLVVAVFSSLLEVISVKIELLSTFVGVFRRVCASYQVCNGKTFFLGRT
jgi:hypothetical protein